MEDRTTDLRAAQGSLPGLRKVCSSTRVAKWRSSDKKMNERVKNANWSSEDARVRGLDLPWKISLVFPGPTLAPYLPACLIPSKAPVPPSEGVINYPGITDEHIETAVCCESQINKSAEASRKGFGYARFGGVEGLDAAVIEIAEKVSSTKFLWAGQIQRGKGGKNEVVIEVLFP